MASASAKDVNASSVTFLGQLAPDTGLDTYGTFASSGTYTAGQSFDEVFLVYAPADSLSSLISFDATATSSGVKFSSIDFGYISSSNYDDSGDLTSYSLASLGLGTDGVTKYFVFGQSPGYVDSGVYYIEFTGTSIVNGGAFTGEASTEAIPEPANAALLLAGLGLFATLARRRNPQA
jgi:hypothetical protein